MEKLKEVKYKHDASSVVVIWVLSVMLPLRLGQWMRRSADRGANVAHGSPRGDPSAWTWPQTYLLHHVLCNQYKCGFWFLYNNIRQKNSPFVSPHRKQLSTCFTAWKKEIRVTYNGQLSLGPISETQTWANLDKHFVIFSTFRNWTWDLWALVYKSTY